MMTNHEEVQRAITGALRDAWNQHADSKGRLDKTFLGSVSKRVYAACKDAQGRVKLPPCGMSLHHPTCECDGAGGNR